MSAEDSLVEANPCKLRNGNWGAKTAEPVEAGDTVQIVTRAGKTWRAEVSTVIWTDGTVCICETASEDKNTAGKKTDKPQTSKTARSKPKSKPAQPAGDTPPMDSEAYGSPAYTADVPPTAVNAHSDELDAMADRAAAESDDDDDLMAAYDDMAGGNDGR